MRRSSSCGSTSRMCRPGMTNSQQRARKMDLLEHAPCAFLSFKDDGIVLAVNATLLDLLGYTREEVVGKHLQQLLGPGGRIFYQTHFFPLLKMRGEAEEI